VQWIHLVQGPMVYTCDVQYSLKFHIGQDTSVINILKASASGNSVTIHSEYLLQLHIFTDMITNPTSLPTLSMCILIYPHNKNQQDALITFNLFLQILSRLTAHHQEVLLCIYSNWYMSCVYVDWLLARSGWNWILSCWCWSIGITKHADINCNPTSTQQKPAPRWSCQQSVNTNTWHKPTALYTE